jgi:hypothetical protein
MRTYKARHQFYLPEDLSGELERLSSRAGTSKTAILTEAFRHWLDRRAGPDIDRQFGQRLDRLSREHGRIHERIDMLAEALGLFIQHQLTLVAHQPPFDETARALGLERYGAFVELVGRRMARQDRPLRLAPREEPQP